MVGWHEPDGELIHGGYSEVRVEVTRLQPEQMAVGGEMYWWMSHGFSQTNATAGVTNDEPAGVLLHHT